MEVSLSRCSTLRPRKARKEKRRKGRTSRDNHYSCSDMVPVSNNELASSPSSSSILLPSPSSVHQWFGGRSVYFRGICDDDDSTTYICKIPGAWLEQSIINDAEKRRRNKGRQPLASLFNHDRRHRDQPQFASTETLFLEGHAGLGAAAWAALGSTIYFFGCYEKVGMDSRDVYYLQNAFTAVRTAAGGRKGLRKACCMIARRGGAKIVALDGKVYVFGGNYDFDNKDNKEEESWAEVFEPYPNHHRGQCRSLSSPPLCDHPDDREPEFAVAIEKSMKIIVSWAYMDPYEYDVVGDYWVKIESKISSTLRNPLCQPVAVGSTLYWLNRELMAYDLSKEMLFSGPLEDLLIQQSLETPDTLPETLLPHDFQVSLLHLAGDFFCLIWVERKILHCTTIQALRTATEGEYNLRASVLSCQTLVSHIPLKLEDPVLML